MPLPTSLLFKQLWLVLFLWVIPSAVMAQPVPMRSFPEVIHAVPKSLPAKPIARPLAAIPAFRSVPSSAQATVRVSVYLMAGQSNLVGEALVENVEPDYGVSFPAVQVWGIAPSAEGTHGERFMDLAPGFSGYYFHFGPELSFGRQLVASTRETVYLIKDGLGATTLEQDWHPDGINNSYDRFTETVDSALANLTAQGITYEIKGLVWMQGESDVWAPGAAEKYEENLVALVSDVRSRYGNTLPIAIGLIRGDLPTGDREPLAQVRAAQRTIAAADPHTVLVNTDALGTGEDVIQPDAVHYNAAGQVLLGKAFAEALTDSEPIAEAPEHAAED